MAGVEGCSTIVLSRSSSPETLVDENIAENCDSVMAPGILLELYCLAIG